MLIANVALPIKLHQQFDYIVPPELIDNIVIGQRVSVPFGNRNLIGIVLSLSNESQFDNNKLKPINQLIDEQPIFSASLWQFLLWSADYYHYPIGEVLFHALPILLRQGRKASLDETYQWQLTELGKTTDIAAFPAKAHKQKMLLHALQHKTLTEANEQDYSTAIYNALMKKSLIERVAIQPEHQTWQTDFSVNATAFSLNQQQQNAIDAIKQQSHFQAFLLDGVTGSGKTEVYLNALNHVLQQGKQALVLVPEIGLTPQTISRFKKRFNAPIAIVHSAMSDKARLTVWLQCQQGKISIVIGTRSALFTPFQSLGMIVIDEEHDGSYKQQEGWRYHARDLAIMRAKIENVPIVLGSATPSLETLNNAKLGRYQHLKLTERAGNASFAKQILLDIKGLPLTAGLSQPLIAQIKKHLEQNNQVILFLNRRGFAPLLICHDCGWIAECPRCDKPYTYHQQHNKLICHHCDTTRQVPSQCPKCGSTHLLPLGFGTEQLEQQLALLFPDIPISRIDRDSTSKKGALEDYLQQITKGGKHILVGTQILAKGHHFPDVTLVGIVDVDGALFSSDFRATERFAQIYTQVSGRAGRENKAGEVILQTYHPDHPLLQLLLNQGYQVFSQQLLLERQMAYLPPFSYQVLIRAADKTNRYAEAFLTKIQHWLKQHIQDQALWILGPTTAIQARKAGYYRWQLLLQHHQRQQLHSILDQLLVEIESWTETNNIRWSIDVDPIDNW